MSNATSKLADRLHLLALPERLVGLLQLKRSFLHTVLQFGFGALHRLKEPRVIDASCGLSRQAYHNPLVAFVEASSFSMTKEESADDLA